MLELALLLALLAGAWFLWDSLKAREAANRAIRGACQSRGFLFLDDTVALARLRPRRNAQGRLTFWRVYSFEFSYNGLQRSGGTIDMLGDRVEQVRIEAPAGADDATVTAG